MSNFILSAFADEYDPLLSAQIEGVKLHDIDYIEIRGVNNKNISLHSLEEVKEIKKELDAGGVKISSVGSPIGKIKITDPMDEHIELFKKIIETAKILDTKYIRLFSFYMPKDEEIEKYRDQVLKRMQMFVDTAKGSGLTLLHENEKGIYGDTDKRCLDILESIGSDSLKAVFDPANFIQSDVATYPQAFNLLLPYIEYVHIKDAGQDKNVVPAGQGIGKIKEILTDLKSRGYNGFLSLEPHLASFQGLASLEEGREKEKISTDTAQKFAIAVNALKKVLSEI